MKNIHLYSMLFSLAKLIIYRFPRIMGLALVATAQATSTTITQWTFDELPRGQNNNPTPDFGSGAAMAIGTEDPEGNAIPPNADVLASLRQGSDSTTPGNAWRIRSTGGFNGYSLQNLTTGARFDVPTAGYAGITIEMDWIPTNNAPGYGQFQYTVNGTDFISFGEPVPSVGGNVWQSLSFDLTGIPEVNDNPYFGFRFVAAYNPHPFTLLTQDEEFNFITIEYGPDEAFVNASDVGNSMVTEAWSPDDGNFRFDTIRARAAETITPGSPQGYAAWVISHFESAEASDPNISGPQATPRGEWNSQFTKIRHGIRSRNRHSTLLLDGGISSGKGSHPHLHPQKGSA